MLQIAKELGIIDRRTLSKNIKLTELREKLSLHPAFSPITKLEKISDSYDIKIIWVPKFHCELNPIEGLWCHSKRYVRENNDQNYANLFKLIEESFIRFQTSNMNIKLWHRFWACIKMYHDGHTYKDVLNNLFSSKKSEKTLTHTKITNTNLEN